MNNKNPFQIALELLGSKNAYDCWRLISFLSAFERFDGTIQGLNFLFPMLNLEKIDMLSKAILLSKAMDYKDAVISTDEFDD